MVKIVDYRAMGWGVGISLLVSIATRVGLAWWDFPTRINVALSVTTFLLGLVITYLHLIAVGVEKFKDSVEKYSIWIRIIADYFGSVGFEIEKLLEQITTIRDKIIARPDSGYNYIAIDILKKVVYQLTELANEEYRTTGQVAFESYIKFIDHLKPNEEYLATSVVGITSFWQNEKMGPLVFEANKRAIRRGVKVKRIFILPSLQDLCQNRAVRDEIKKHKSSGINVIVAFEESLPIECKRDIGIFNDEIVGYLELGAKDTFLGVRYYFASKEVENARLLYKMIEEFDVVKLYGYESLDYLFDVVCEGGKDATKAI